MPTEGIVALGFFAFCIIMIVLTSRARKKPKSGKKGNGIPKRYTFCIT